MTNYLKQDKKLMPDMIVDYIDEGNRDEVKLRFNFDINPLEVDRLFKQREKRRLKKLQLLDKE